MADYLSRRPQAPERLWYLSSALERRGRHRLAVFVKRVNAFLFHNSLPVKASVGRGLRLEHHGFGVMIHENVTIGRRVRMWHDVTITSRGHAGKPASVVIEDDVRIGAHAIIIAPPGKVMKIGRAARIGAGAIVTDDVAPGATMVGASAQALMHRADNRLTNSAERAAREETSRQRSDVRDRA